MKQLSPEAVAGFTEDQFVEIKPKALFSADQVSNLSKSIVREMGDDQLEALPVKSFAGFTQDQAKSLPVSFLEDVGAKLISKFSPKRLQASSQAGFNASTLSDFRF